MTTLSTLHQLSNAALRDEAVRLAATERGATAALIAALAEIDARRLYLGEGCASMFVYCTRVLHLSEHAAYDRIEAARLARRLPAVLLQLELGALSLTNLRLLAPYLTVDTVAEVMADAAFQTKQEVEQLIARLRPQPVIPPTIRKLPQQAPPAAAPIGTGTLVAPTVPADSPQPEAMPVQPRARRSVVQPLAPERYKVQFTISERTREILRRVQDLMRHSVPNGDLAAIFERGLSLLLENLEKRKTAAVVQPRTAPACRGRSRHIPASVRREVWRRDGGRCAFVGSQGRCTETGRLEFHHVKPYAAAGLATPENIALRCRAHNAYEAELFFGEA